jgi:hypothetical protein
MSVNVVFARPPPRQIGRDDKSRGFASMERSDAREHHQSKGLIHDQDMNNVERQMRRSRGVVSRSPLLSCD